MYLGDFAENATIRIIFNTFTSDDPSASCTITNFANTDVHIHKDNGLTQRNNAAGITVSVDFDGITGSHMIEIDTSNDTVAGFWVTGSDYYVRIEGTTIDAATINSLVGQFSIENRYNPVTDYDGPTNTEMIAAFTEIKGATWAAGTDTLEHIRNKQTDIETDTTEIGVAGAGLTNINLPNQTMDITGTLSTVTNLTNAPTNGDLTATMKTSVNAECDTAMTDYDGPTNTEMIAAFTEIKGATWAAGTDTLEHIRNKQTDIETDTAEIGVAGAGLTNINLPNQTMDITGTLSTVTNLTNAPTNGDLTAAMKASVNTEADNAIETYKLDHLVAVADADDAVNDSIIAKMAASDGDWSGFDKTTDSLEAVRDRGDTAWITGAGGSDRLIMADTTIATLASQTSFTLTAGSTDNDAYNNCTIVIEDAATAVQKAVGLVSAYTGATKTVTLKYDPGVFTMAITDKVYVLAENALKSTQGNRQLDVTSSGGAGIDWGNIENKTTANDLSATDIQLCDTTTTVTGLEAHIEDLKALNDLSGDIFYVSKTGDDSTGLSWATAKTTIDAAVALCTANHGDIIYIAPGTYDETAGGTAGIACDVAGITIDGMSPGAVTVKNTNTTNAGSVFTITAHNIKIKNVLALKGETISDNAVVLYVNGANITCDMINVIIDIEKSTFTGIKFNGGAVSCSFMDACPHFSHIYSSVGVGLGIDFANCVGCVVIGTQIHDLTTGLKFSDGANSIYNTISPETVIVSCTYGIEVTLGAFNNILSALVLNSSTADYLDNSGNDWNVKEGSLTYVLSDIRAAIVETSPQTHLANASSTVTYGSVASGTYPDTNTENDIYWQLNPDAVNTLDMYSQFSIGTGRTPSNVEFNGRFQSHVARYCQVDAWNYATSSWETISSDSNRIGHATSDFDRSWSLTSEHAKVSDGEMKIRVYSTSTTIGDDLYLDLMVVNSVASAAGGLTADAITQAVWDKSVVGFTGTCTMGTRLKNLNAICGAVSVSDTASSFTVDEGVTVADAYVGMLIRLSDADNGYSETRRITDWTAGRVITVDRAFSFIPAVADYARILNQYGVTDVGAVTTGTLATIQGKTDTLPAGFAKNVALSNFTFNAVLTSDHYTAAPGLTVTAQISKDGGAFAACTNAVAEISLGFYKIDLTQAEMNADIIALNFTDATADDRNFIIKTDS